MTDATLKCQTWNAAKAWISRKGSSDPPWLLVEAIVNLTTPCPMLDGAVCVSDDPNFSLFVHDDPLSDVEFEHRVSELVSPSVLQFSGGSELLVAMEVTKDRSGRSKREIKLRSTQLHIFQRHNLITDVSFTSDGKFLGGATYLKDESIVNANRVIFTLQFDDHYRVTEIAEEPIDPWWRALLDLGIIFFHVYVYASIVMMAMDKVGEACFLVPIFFWYLIFGKVSRGEPSNALALSGPLNPNPVDSQELSLQPGMGAEEV